MGRSRRGNRLVKIPRMAGFVSPRLGVRFEPGQGRDDLTIIGRNGQPFITPLEMFRRAEGARSLAEYEHQLAEDERQRAERLAAKLRELGVEPD